MIITYKCSRCNSWVCVEVTQDNLNSQNYMFCETCKKTAMGIYA